MSAIKFFFFLALAVACVYAVEESRVKKQVLLGGYPYTAGVYSAGYVPTAYSAGYVPTAYSAGYAGVPAAYSAYSAYPYNAGLYRSYHY